MREVFTKVLHCLQTAYDAFQAYCLTGKLPQAVRDY